MAVTLQQIAEAGCFQGNGGQGAEQPWPHPP